jgi:hypothetical protein
VFDATVRVRDKRFIFLKAPNSTAWVSHLDQMIIWAIQVLVQFDDKTFEKRRKFSFDFYSFRVLSLLGE